MIVAEDSALLRAGLVELLAAEDMTVVAAVGDTSTLAGLVRDEDVDVVVLDIRMPPTHTTEGLDAALALRAEHGRRIGILLLSQHVESRHVLDLLRTGSEGVGYLLKDRVLDASELGDAIRRVGAGGSALDPVVVDRIFRRRHDDDTIDTLTPREREVLAVMAEGRSNQAIAERLSISQKTVEACVGRIFSKLGLEAGADDHRRVRAVLTYLRDTST